MVQPFPRNYEKIVMGEDQSTFIKIQTLEQVQKLMLISQKSGIAVPRILKEIYTDLAIDVGFRPEMIILNADPLNPQELKDELLMRKGELKRNMGTFSASVTYEDLDTRLEVQKDAKGQPTGLATLSYLLYQGVLSGDALQAANALEQFAHILTQYLDPADFKIDLPEAFQLVSLFSKHY